MSNRVTGKHAKLYYGSTLIAEMKDCKVTVSPEYATSRGWDRSWTVRDNIGCDWKVTASKYDTTANFGYFIALAGGTPAETSPLTLQVFALKNGTNVPVISGPVVIGEGGISLPEAEHTSEDLEFLGDGPPASIGGLAVTTT